MQGPVRQYSHRFGMGANVLATPFAEHGASAEFLTFGLPPWLHLLFWPDGRQALIQFLPDGVDRCRMQVSLLGPADRLAEGEALMAEMVHFLEEDPAPADHLFPADETLARCFVCRPTLKLVKPGSPDRQPP